MSAAPPPLLQILADPSYKPKVIMQRELTPDEEFAIIAFAMVRAYSRWGDRWAEEIGQLVHANISALEANGGEFPPAEEGS